MEEMSSSVTVKFSLGNSICDESGIISRVEIKRVKLAKDATTFLSDTHTPKVAASDGRENENRESRATDKDEILSIIDDAKSVINEGLLVVNTGSRMSLPKSLEIENGKVLAKAIIMGESSIEQVPTGEILLANMKIPANSDSKATEMVIQWPCKENPTRGTGRRVFELECIPLWGSVSVIGGRKEMEDAIAAMPGFIKIPTKMLAVDPLIGESSQTPADLTAHFFGVYDGHGGSQVANYCRDRIHFALTDEISSNVEYSSRQVQWETIFTSCFRKVDDEVGGKVSRCNTGNASESVCEPVAPETVGSTAVVALVCSSHIIVANCGDSRAVLCRSREAALPLSVDHKPDREDEHQRIEACGGKVFMWMGARVSGVLAMSRSIGDRYLKPSVIADPEVMVVSRKRNDECLILASDGLWDVMTNEEACDVARRRIMGWHKKNGVPPLAERGNGIDPAAQAAADCLSNLAIHRGSQDNISVIVVDLKAQRKPKTKP